MMSGGRGRLDLDFLDLFCDFEDFSDLDVVPVVFKPAFLKRLVVISQPALFFGQNMLTSTFTCRDFYCLSFKTTCTFAKPPSVLLTFTFLFVPFLPVSQECVLSMSCLYLLMFSPGFEHFSTHLYPRTSTSSADCPLTRLPTANRYRN